MIISFHLEKCAGTSLQHLLRSLYGNKFYQHRIEDQQGCKEELLAMNPKPEIIHGHMFYGIHNLFNNVNADYISVLRDPVERFISHYYHCLTRNDNRPRFEGKKPNLEEFCGEPYRKYHNLLTRRLSGNKENEMTKGDLDQAYERISKFKLIGFFDDLNRFLYMMSRIYNWESVPEMPRKNGSGCLKLYKELTPEVYNKLLTVNLFDITLYYKMRIKFLWESTS